MKKILLFSVFVFVALTLKAASPTPADSICKSDSLTTYKILGGNDSVTIYKTLGNNEIYVRNDSHKELSVSLYNILGEIQGKETTVSPKDELPLYMGTIKKGLYLLIIKKEGKPFETKKIFLNP